MPLEVERCQQEIEELEAHLRAGHPDVEGLCVALRDWHAELQLLKRYAGMPQHRRSRARKR